MLPASTIFWLLWTKDENEQLLHFGGFELQDVYESFEDSGNTYNNLKQAFYTYFEPQTNSSFEIFNFQKTVQTEEENIKAYFLRLRDMASRCGFDDTNEQVKTQLILGTSSQKLRKYCFAKHCYTWKIIRGH